MGRVTPQKSHREPCTGAITVLALRNEEHPGAADPKRSLAKDASRLRRNLTDISDGHDCVLHKESCASLK